MKAAQRLLAAAMQEYKFQALVGDANGTGRVSFTVEAKNQANAWKVFVKKHANLLPQLKELKLL